MRKKFFVSFLPFLFATSMKGEKKYDNLSHHHFTVNDSIPHPNAPSGIIYNRHVNGNRLQLGASGRPQAGSLPQGVLTADRKVIISNDDNNLEINPNTGSTGGVTIEPINRVTGQSVSTRFFMANEASWSFFTNASERLLISPEGTVTTRNSLLVNDAKPDGKSALRVRGTSRFDTSISIMSGRDSAGFISINSAVKSAAYEPDDDFSPYTSTPMEWANGRNIPVFRLRHPSNASSAPDGLNRSLQRDFLILPYQFGTAIEYNGVVECWVGEWSIHKGLHYNDAEGNGTGWGGILWVGDDIDAGGIRFTSRNNLGAGGNLNYGEVSVEKYAGAPNGNLRFRLPVTGNNFQFIYGPRGSSNVIASISNQGLVLPQIGSTSGITAPVRGQIAYDTSSNLFKGFNGNSWVNIQENPIRTGAIVMSGNGVTSIFTIPHGLGQLPGYFNAVPTSPDAANIRFISANSTDIIIHYASAPANGLNNLSWNWEARR